jgi:hypothetical protein
LKFFFLIFDIRLNFINFFKLLPFEYFFFSIEKGLSRYVVERGTYVLLTIFQGRRLIFLLSEKIT